VFLRDLLRVAVCPGVRGTGVVLAEVVDDARESRVVEVVDAGNGRVYRLIADEPMRDPGSMGRRREVRDRNAVSHRSD
jgi:hypothetical protein